MEVADAVAWCGVGRNAGKGSFLMSLVAAEGGTEICG